jgi:RNA polymerase sigma factor (sigma-70 family)
MTVLDDSDIGLAIEDLLTRLQPKLRRILARYQIPPEDADDIVQTTMLDLVYKQELINNPEGWVLGSVRNRCVIYWRKRRSQLYEAVDSAILELLAKPAGPSQHQAGLRHDLERVLRSLPQRCQDILKLRYGLGYGPTEVAEALGYKPSSIRKVTNRCLARLTRQLVAIGFYEPDESLDEP